MVAGDRSLFSRSGARGAQAGCGLPDGDQGIAAEDKSLFSRSGARGAKAGCGLPDGDQGIAAGDKSVFAPGGAQGAQAGCGLPQDGTCMQQTHLLWCDVQCRPQMLLHHFGGSQSMHTFAHPMHTYCLQSLYTAPTTDFHVKLVPCDTCDALSINPHEYPFVLGHELCLHECPSNGLALFQNTINSLSKLAVGAGQSSKTIANTTGSVMKGAYRTGNSAVNLFKKTKNILTR